ncbi:MAG: hypothetical protein ABI717_00790 [Actinomycetota bacterium]
MTVTAARHAVNTAALARDRVALVALGASLPATIAYAYERHRAGAYAHALEGSGDAALGELAVAAASMPPSAAVLAADGAGLHLLLGDPARAIASIAGAARSDLPFDTFGRDVLLAATREAPSEWRRAARAAALVRHPRAALVALGAAFNAMGDRRAYRVALAATGLLTALVALLALPTLLVDGGSPVAGVTAPSFAAPPSVVVVPNRPPQPRPRRRDAVPPLFFGGQATLVSGSSQQPAPLEPPGRPRAVGPRPVAPPAPAPSPSPSPAPAPAPQPSPQPVPPPVSLAVAPAAPAPAAPAPQPKAGKGKGKAKGHAKQEARAAAAAASPPRAAAPAPKAQPPATAEPPGQAKDDKHDKSDKQDKDKGKD